MLPGFRAGFALYHCNWPCLRARSSKAMSPAVGAVTEVRLQSYFALKNVQHYFRTNSKVRCQLFLGVVRETGEMKERGRGEP